MNDDLIQRLLFAETEFLDVLQTGSMPLASYCESLSVLPNALSTAAKIGAAGNMTLSLAHSVASRIFIIASCYLRVKREETDFSAQLRIDCDAMIQQMNALDLNARPKSLRSDESPDMHYPTLPPTLASHTESSSSAVPAYRWLLENLHNPYPSRDVKARIAADSSCRVSSIDSWFINARRRIGWTTLRREHFLNSRADMLNAAYRALVEEDPRRELTPELRHAFVAMRVAAEGLYPSILARSTLTEDLDAMIKGMPEEDEGSVEVERQTKVNNPKAAHGSYPSPDTWVTASPVPVLSDSFTDDSGEEEDVAPAAIAGSKRRRSSIDPVNELSSAFSRPIKRLRFSAILQSCLLSPPCSTDGIDTLPKDNSPILLPKYPPPAETIEVLPHHKWSHFDASATGIPQCPSDSTASPLPGSDGNEYSVDDWFNTNFNTLFDIPPPVDVTKPDFSAPWEVEMFQDYKIPVNTKYAPKCPPPTLESAISAPDDFSDLDNLLQSICSDSFAPSSIILPTNIPADSYTKSLTSDFSQVNPDWMSLLGAETSQPTLSQYPIDSQPLSEIDLSMLQLPHVMFADDTQSDFVSKQTKLHQLHSMQEAVRRMEQELRFEGVIA